MMNFNPFSALESLRASPDSDLDEATSKPHAKESRAARDSNEPGAFEDTDSAIFSSSGGSSSGGPAPVHEVVDEQIARHDFTAPENCECVDGDSFHWKCGRCTYRNSAERRRCSVCFTDRESALALNEVKEFVPLPRAAELVTHEAVSNAICASDEVESYNGADFVVVNRRKGTTRQESDNEPDISREDVSEADGPSFARLDDHPGASMHPPGFSADFPYDAMFPSLIESPTSSGDGPSTHVSHFPMISHHLGVFVPHSDAVVCQPTAASIQSKPMAPLERYAPSEHPLHERYMLTFRTNLCALHLDKRCPNDAFTCFDSHSKQARRRPLLLPNGEYNYAPTRCRSVQTSHGKRKCPQGDICRYAHSTEEMIYHPLVYKTQLCPHSLGDGGMCTGFGIHCAKAHGTSDQRHPSSVSVPERIQVTSAALAIDETSLAAGHQMDGIPFELDRDDPAFYMFLYKTERCPHKSCPRTCERYHNLKERRRSPRYFYYSEHPCPYVKSSGATKNWRDPSRCPDGDSCLFSHTLLEQMYHPRIYKTSPCNNYGAGQPSRCTWGPLCTHAHGVGDMERQAGALSKYAEVLAKAPDMNSTSVAVTLKPGEKKASIGVVGGHVDFKLPYFGFQQPGRPSSASSSYESASDYGVPNALPETLLDDDVPSHRPTGDTFLASGTGRFARSAVDESKIWNPFSQGSILGGRPAPPVDASQASTPIPHGSLEGVANCGSGGYNLWSPAPVRACTATDWSVCEPWSRSQSSLPGSPARCSPAPGNDFQPTAGEFQMSALMTKVDELIAENTRLGDLVRAKEHQGEVWRREFIQAVDKHRLASQRLLCPVCSNAERSQFMTPCGHSTCDSCLDSTSCCPICNVAFAHSHRIQL